MPDSVIGIVVPLHLFYYNLSLNTLECELNIGGGNDSVEYYIVLYMSLIIISITLQASTRQYPPSFCCSLIEAFHLVRHNFFSRDGEGHWIASVRLDGDGHGMVGQKKDSPG
jgi:hypothetical protein